MHGYVPNTFCHPNPDLGFFMLYCLNAMFLHERWGIKLIIPIMVPSK